MFSDSNQAPQLVHNIIGKPQMRIRYHQLWNPKTKCPIYHEQLCCLFCSVVCPSVAMYTVNLVAISTIPKTPAYPACSRSSLVNTQWSSCRTSHLQLLSRPNQFLSCSDSLVIQCSHIPICFCTLSLTSLLAIVDQYATSFNCCKVLPIVGCCWLSWTSSIKSHLISITSYYSASVVRVKWEYGLSSQLNGWSLISSWAGYIYTTSRALRGCETRFAPWFNSLQ